MNAQERHAAAAAKMEQLERAFDKLFAEVNADPDGEKHWMENYQSRYDAMDRMEDAAYRVYWYTDPQNSQKIKQRNHRITVAKMRAAGLHRMATIKKKRQKMEAITINNLKERHDKFISLWGKWDYNNPKEFAKNYDKEEFILHILLNSEFYYTRDQHTTKQATLFVNYLFPGTTKEEMMNVYYKYLNIVTEIYG